MKKLLAIICACTLTLTVACQDKDFYKKTNHFKGLYTTYIQFPDSSKLTTANLGSADWSTITGKPSVFPSSWEILLNKPTVFPPAAHNHDALYKPLSWFPTWDEVTGKPSVFPSSWALVVNKPTFSTVATTGDYNDLLNKPTGISVAWVDITGKPATYPSTWTDVANKPTFATVATTGSYTNLINIPTTFPSTWTTVSGKPTFATVATTGSYTDLLNIPTTFTPAVHNHDALYKPIGYVPAWVDITGKPATFPSTWATVSGKPTFATVATTGSYIDLLNIPLTFTPKSHTHDYNTDITNKPVEEELDVAIAGLDFLPVPRKTTAQINAMVMPANTCGFVRDITTNVLKFWDGTIWNVVILSY